MTMCGAKSTVEATMEMMTLFTQSVARGAPNKWIVGDLPFLSCRQNQTIAMRSIMALMQAGAHAVKLEGCDGNLELIAHCVNSGVPVMGHLGLTPQSVNVMGGYKVQGKTKQAATRIIKEARQLQEAGCFALVLECVPEDLAKEITEDLAIPTIGIGAGVHTSGQVLVLQDLLGMNLDFRPKFVKPYLSGADLMLDAMNQYAKEVETQTFPSDEYSFQIKAKPDMNQTKEEEIVE